MNIDRSKVVCLNELMCIHVREDNWKTKVYHQEVEAHYDKLLNALENPTHKDLKILIFHPVCTGDVVISSICLEQLQIKYPGCTVDYFTEALEAIPILESNPLLGKAIVDKNWDRFRTRDTRYDISNGCPTRDGPLLKEYDLGYSVYWWRSPQIESFLEDFDLPTDYTRLRIYPTESSIQKANEFWKDVKDFRIVLQIEGSKWHKDKYYQELKEKLIRFGTIKELGRREGFNYADDAAIIEQADLMICSSGSIEHVAAAVRCQTITLSPIYNPIENCAAYYQNKYLPKGMQHHIIRPIDWCGNYKCVIRNPDEMVQKEPHYGYDSEGKFPLIHTNPCDYKDFKKSCIHEITPDEIIKKVEEVIAIRQLDK